MVYNAVFVVAAFVIIIASCDTVGGTAPLPGNSGIIIISNIGATSLTLSWERADDDATAQEDLEYRAYYATVSSIETVEDIEANALPVGVWEKDIVTKDVTGLEELTDYYFTVLVRDADGNMAVYGVVSQTTYMTVTVTFQNVPLSGQSIELSITGEGVDDISESYPVGTTEASIVVPPGLQRSFEAFSWMTSVAMGAKVETDLLNVDDADITITFALYKTKIIIPDAENNRVVQIDDMSGAGWTELNWNNLVSSSTESGFSFAYEFEPYDIDFDSQGRIYIANYAQNGDTGEGVLRIDDINDTVYDNIISLGMSSIAIDRANGWLYYSTSFNPDLKRSNLEGVLDTDYSSVVNPSSVSGLAVDETGMVYATLLYEGNDVMKFDPENPIDKTVVWVSGYPEDVIVKTSYAYVVDSEMYTLRTYAVEDLKEGEPYGSQDDGNLPDNPGEFFGPRRFVAPVNKKLYIIDHNMFNRKLAALEGSTGAGWETYGTAGTGTGQFKFYSAC